LGVLYQLRDKEGDQDRAEAVFKDILAANEKLIDVRLNLGLLYEAEGKKDAAVAEYLKMLSFLPANVEENKQLREQIQKLIDNVRSGVGNLSNKEASVAPAEVVPQAETTLPQAPAGPNESALPGSVQ
jgi:tetratricopeptide (TPR) repeat protein